MPTDAAQRGDAAIAGFVLSPEEFRDRFSRLLNKAPDGVIRECHFVDCAAEHACWTTTGIELEAGARMTAMMVCHTGASWIPGAWSARRIQFRARVGSTEMIFHSGRNTHSFVAPESGKLHVAIWPPDDDSPDPTSRIPSADDCTRAGLTISMAIIKWKESSLRGLRYLASIGDVQGLVRTEIERLCDPVDAAEGRPPASAVPPRNPP
jgi:hypothetical protein